MKSSVFYIKTQTANTQTCLSLHTELYPFDSIMQFLFYVIPVRLVIPAQAGIQSIKTKELLFLILHLIKSKL